MLRSTAGARIVVVCVLLLGVSCAPDSSSGPGGKGSAESYAKFRPRDLQALQALEPFQRPQRGFSNLTLDPDSGQIKNIWINAYYPEPTGAGTTQHKPEELRAGAVTVFAALAKLQSLESVSIPYLPPDFQEHVNKLEGLTELNLTSSIDDSLAASLAKHPTLQTLRIYSSLLAPAHLEQLATLPWLQHIALGDTLQSPNTGVAYLAQCPQLKSVKLAIMQVAPDDLRKLAPLKLRKLVLQSIAMDTQEPQGVRELLAEIPAFTELEELELDGLRHGRSTGGDGPLLTGFEKLHKLKRLTLHDLTLTREDLRTLGKLTALEYLSIRIPYLPGEAFADLATLTNLRELHYDGEIAPTALAEMAPLPEVTTVSLRMPGRDAETYAPLQHWPKLQNATFLEQKPNDQALEALAALHELPGCTNLVRAASEGKLPKLKRLECWMAPQSAELQKLSAHPSLQAIAFTREMHAWIAPEVKPATIKSLQVLPWLRELKVRSSKLGKQHLAELRQLPPLDRLDLSGNALTDEYVPDLAALANVKLLDLRGTQLTLKGLTELHELRPEMIVLAP